MLKKIICLFAFALLVAVTGNTEPKVDFYGNISFGTWWSKEWDFTDSIVNVIGTDTIMGEDPTPTANLDVMPFGFLGLNLAKEKLKFCFEMGIGRTTYDFQKSRSYTSGDFLVRKNGFFVRFKKFFADWNINDHFTLQIGQNVTPANFSTSNQALFGGNDINGMNNCGVLEDGARPMMQFEAKRNFGKGIQLSGKAAVIMVDTMLMTLPTDFRIKDTSVVDTSTGQTVIKSKIIANKVMQENKNLKANVQIPKLEGSIDFSLTYRLIDYTLHLAGGFQQYDIVYKHPPYYNEENIYPKATLQSYVWGVDNKLSIGRASIAYTCAGGKNLGIYGITIGNPFKWRGFVDAPLVNIFYPWGRAAGTGSSELNGVVWALNDLVDPDLAKSARTLDNSYAMEMAWIGRVKPWEFVAAEGGYGIVKASHDDESRNQWWHDTRAWYGQLEFTIANVLVITPEVGYIYYGPARNQGQLSYGGMNARIKF
jgi:hypothetical protein